MLACFIFNSWLLFFFYYDLVSIAQKSSKGKTRLSLLGHMCHSGLFVVEPVPLHSKQPLPSAIPLHTHIYTHTHKIPLKMSIVFSQYSYPLNTHSRPGTICGPPQPAPPNLHPQVSLTCGDVLFRYGSHFQHEILFLNLKLQIKNFLKL